MRRFYVMRRKFGNTSWRYGSSANRAVLAVAVFATLLGAASAPSRAQVGIPSLLQLPGGVARSLQQDTQGALGQIDAQTSATLRAARIRVLLDTNRRTLEADPRGAPMLRGRVLAIAPSAAGLAAARGAGFEIVEDRTLEGVDLRVVVFSVPQRLSTAAALRRLRALDPAGSYDFEHLYTDSGATDRGAAAMSGNAAGAAGALAPSEHGDATWVRARVGLVDSGIDLSHPAFHGAPVEAWGCGGRRIATAHGTAVASLLMGHTREFHGAAPGAALFAADVYCGESTGGSVVEIAAALGWLMSRQVTVINISLVGPANLLFEQTLQRLQQRGVLIVAAVGNDGPAAAPLYPAAYPGVIGVTAVDAQRRVLLEACRGRQVSFAAPGSDMAAAGLDASWVNVRGTSFAAPIVAGLLARDLDTPDVASANAAVEHLAGQAIDLGPRGTDRIYGRGLVGAEIRVVLERVVPVAGPQSSTLKD